MREKYKMNNKTQENKGTKKNLQEEFQRVLIDLENYRRQFDSIVREIQIFELTISELNSSIETLNSLEKENKSGKEILVPIGSNSYIRAELKDTEKVLIGFGAGVSIEKTVEEAKKTLEERKENLMKLIEDLQKKSIELRNKISQLTPMAEKMVQELRE